MNHDQPFASGPYGPEHRRRRRRCRTCGRVTSLVLAVASLSLVAAGAEDEAHSKAQRTLSAVAVPSDEAAPSFACKVGGRTAEVSASRGPAHNADHPWQVTLSADGRGICGGILLGAEWVLTGGYCVADARPRTLAVGYGVTDLGVSEVQVHPERDPANFKNDIALLRLAGAINARNSYANLPDKDETRALERPGNCAVVTGYGQQSGSSPSIHPYRLQVANAVILSREECRAAYGESLISEGEICAGGPRAAVAMPGDGGGALTVGGSPNRPRWLVGVVSWGEGSYGDPDAKPDVYTRVSQYREWIERTMAKPPSPPVVSGAGAGVTGGGARAPRPGDVWESPLGMEFVWIPAGTFVMGSPDGEAGRDGDERQHEVTISQGFWMGRYEVTQGWWEAVMGSNISYFIQCGARCPVEGVSWEDVREFIRRLNAFIRQLNAKESGSGYEYRLPSEAEWEYAARAGTTGARYGELDEIAWWSGNSGNRLHPVGLKRPNAWGLHDMLGSVWEWTADWYGAYPSGAVTDPAGPRTGSGRVDRGGSWNLNGGGAGDVRSAYRGYRSPGARHSYIGFRLVRTD